MTTQQVIIVTGPRQQLVESIRSSLSQANAMEAFMIVPVVIAPLEMGQGETQGEYQLATLPASSVIDNTVDNAASGGWGDAANYVGTPVSLSTTWDEVVRSEVATALEQRRDALERGITLQVSACVLRVRRAIVLYHDFIIPCLVALIEAVM